MATILWPEFSDAASDFLHRGKCCRVAARRLQRAGTLTTFLQAAYYFFPYFFRRIFAAALWTNRCQRSRSCLAFLLGEFFGQQKRPRVRPLRCFHEMCGLIPVSIFPLFILKRVVERWPLREAVA